MPPSRGARGVVVEARAKLNLGLAVGPRRPDGFHDLATIFQSVTLADTLEARAARSGFRLTVRSEDATLNRRLFDTTKIPTGARNLVLRAARALARRAGIRGGARFRLIKRIPARSGLGGGSADAAAAIVAMNALYELGLSREERLAMALELGSDVPFAITGGTALGFGRGEILTRLPLERPFRALIAVPRWGVSTARAFARLRRRKYGLTAWEAKLRFARKIGRKRLTPERALLLGNALEDVLGDRRADLLSLRSRLSRAGAGPVLMTGSGSAVFGLLDPGTSFSAVAGRFAGREALYGVRSARAGLRLRTL